MTWHRYDVWPDAASIYEVADKEAAVLFVIFKEHTVVDEDELKVVVFNSLSNVEIWAKVPIKEGS